MAVMNMRLWRKAYMFEFRSKDKNEYFSFAVPPESEDFDFGQRITETKTMGGSVFDDYGNDTVSIQLRGSTINEEKKLVYGGKDGKFIPRYLSGEKEIFELQKLINEWGKGNNIPRKEIYLYDLSKMSVFQILGGKSSNSLKNPYFDSGTPSRNYWRVVIKKLKISRSKDKPNTYNYNLDMIGMADTGYNLPPSFFSGGMAKVLDSCQEALEGFQTFYELIEGVADAIDTTTSAIMETKKAFDAIKNGETLTIIDKVLDSPIRMLTGGSSASLYNTAKSLIASGKRISALVNGEEDGTKSTGSVSRDDQFLVTFNSKGGSYVKAEQVAYSRMAKRPEDPTKERYSFAGWYSDEALTEEYDFTDEVIQNITLYAKWTQITAIVTFNSRLGTPIQAMPVIIGGIITPPDPSPTRNGFSFEYWCTDLAAQNKFDFLTSIISDITLYARWKPVCTVAFNSNGGSAVENQVIDIGGKAIYPPRPIWENYFFGIWCTDVELTTEYDFSTPVSSSFSLYAKWSRISNDVHFISNGGSEVSEQTVLLGGFATEPDDPVRDGYNFIRWCSDLALTQEFLFPTTPINYPITLYAAWEIKTQSIKFISNGGSAVESQIIEYGKRVVYPLTPTKDRCLFARWCTDVELTAGYDFSTPVANDMTLYADWYKGT